MASVAAKVRKEFWSVVETRNCTSKGNNDFYNALLKESMEDHAQLETTLREKKKQFFDSLHSMAIKYHGKKYYYNLVLLLMLLLGENIVA